MTLASAVAILAIIGLFPGSADELKVSIMGGFAVSLLIVLPLSGIVAFGLLDWEVGRGPGIARAADAAAFLLASVELSEGAVGLGRWILGVIAILAASGLASTLIVTPPRRPGFRR
jgi:hypothetical protein